eukprot:6654868-Ditylum_brightwellii.AAC.1
MTSQCPTELVVSPKECLKLMHDEFKSPQYWFTGLLLHVIYTSLLGLMANIIAEMVSKSKIEPSRERKWRRKTNF